MAHRRQRLTGACVGAATAGLLMLGMTHTAVDDMRIAADATDPAPPSPAAGPPGPGSTGVTRPASTAGYTPMGAFTSSGADGVQRIADLQQWLGGTNLTVGHTYLPGESWDNIEGDPELLQPWAKWKKAEPDRLFVLNVPMQERNEQHVSDSQVRSLLRSGAAGRFDSHFTELARRLVALGVPDTVVVLGWEMNGTTYTHRCGPDPASWKTYWNRIVTAMRAVPGQRFRFDFAPNRGQDAIGWTSCYPGDSTVDIIGMDSYDQPPGDSFYDQVEEPFGLQAQVDFAAEHNKAISYPEWGLFRNGDNADYMRMMLQWINDHRPVYQTLTDYCPHGVWQCADNPKSSKVFRSTNFARVEPTPTPVPTPVPTPTTTPTTTPSPTTTPTTTTPTTVPAPTTTPSETPTTTPSGTPTTAPSVPPTPADVPAPAPTPTPADGTTTPAESPTVPVSPAPVDATTPPATVTPPAAPAVPPTVDPVVAPAPAPGLSPAPAPSPAATLTPLPAPGPDPAATGVTAPAPAPTVMVPVPVTLPTIGAPCTPTPDPGFSPAPSLSPAPVATTPTPTPSSTSPASPASPASPTAATADTAAVPPATPAPIVQVAGPVCTAVPVGPFKPAPTLSSPSAPAEVCLPLDMGDEFKRQFGTGKLCFRVEWQTPKKS